MWATLENKQKFIGQIMTSKSPVRSCEDLDETALTYAEVKALATGDERIKEKMDLEVDVAKLKLVRANYLSQKYALEDALLKRFPQEIAREKARIAGYAADIERLTAHDANPTLGMELGGIVFTERKDAGAALLATCKAQPSPEQVEIGTYRGFDLLLSFDALNRAFRLTLKGALSHNVDLGDDLFGNLQRIDNVLGALPDRLESAKERLSDLEQQKSSAAEEVKKPFLQEEELNEKCARLAALDAELNIDKERGESVAVLEESELNNMMEQETDQEERTSVITQLREFAESEILPSRQMRVCAAMEER